MGNLDEDMKQCHRAGMKWAGIPCNDNGDEVDYDENGKEYIVQSVEDAECRMKGMRWNGKCWVHTEKSREWGE